MFKIQDGREMFYQWDTDRKLIVGDNNIREVHFCNKTDDCSLVCETYIEDGLNIVNVPNILLQDIWRIYVYAYDKNYTKYEADYSVKPRTKPNDYVYEETDIIRYGTLAESIRELEDRVNEEAESLDTLEIRLDNVEEESADSLKELADKLKNIETNSANSFNVLDNKVNEVEASGEEAIKALDNRIKTIEDNGTGELNNTLIVREIGNKTNTTHKEIATALEDGKAVLLVCEYGEVMLYTRYGVSPDNQEECYIFTSVNVGNVYDRTVRSIAYVFSDGTVSIRGEVNNNEIPTMTATVKGGAMLGNGLKIENDVLSVDESILSSATNAANNKYIVGVKEGSNITFSKTAAEIYDIGQDILTYDVVLIDGKYLYRATTIRIYSTSSKFITLGFTSYNDLTVLYYSITFYKTTNRIECLQPYQPIHLQYIPSPSTGSEYKLLATKDGKYELIDGNNTDDNNTDDLLIAMEVDGILSTIQTQLLLNIVEKSSTGGKFNINMVVIIPYGETLKTYNIYSMIKVDNIDTIENMYAIFSNGIDKNIKMDVEGNFSYME